MTIGRNNPCPCGSGKKYKKCHGGKEVVSIQQVVDNELNSIIKNFYSEYPERKDIHELRMLLGKWNSRLRGFWPPNRIEQQLVDYYLLLQKQDIWKKYVEKQLQKTVRPSVIQVLEKWTSPMMIIGEVLETQQQGFVQLKEIVDGNVYELDTLGGDSKASVGSYVVGIVLPDSRRGSNAIMVLSGVAFLPSKISNGLEQVKQLAEESNLDTQVFYREHMLDCLTFIHESETSDHNIPEIEHENKKLESDIDEQKDTNMTEKQTEMLVALEEMMNEKAINNDRLIHIYRSYLTECAPNPRKAGAVAAGAIRFAKERLSAEEFPWTNKEIAAMFEVSTSTVQKYFEEIDAFSAVPV
ncbi:YecA family protein [Psychrobacillus sp. OK032]|uniref:YecA family protein n=1 Tax=Psychrobacillus sp. OK032 TaxID=1884358 RepID=UPI0008D4459C|nr:SEC-C domain-containing protein [Psychrobacillus sp. OK032]SER71340.1 SEC-C motif-containing protein [Psychrobacillus sp. OK032]